MNPTRAETRFLLAIDRFLQARSREQKVQAARWVNAWDKRAKAAPFVWPDPSHPASTSLLNTSDTWEVQCLIIFELDETART